MSGGILLTGGTGFVGAATLRVLLPAVEGRRVHLLVHRRSPETVGGDGVRLVPADLGQPSSLRGICDEVETVVHLAARIGGDEATCQLVNHHGTAALLAEARRAGVRRIVALSTAAVYGDGVHRGPTEDQLDPRPVSPTSRSRYDAERLVRAAGGVVLRPMFVTGPGDTWFLPTLLDLVRALGCWVDEGRAWLSTIRVEHLGAVIATAATGPPLTPGEVYHATDPCPVRVRDLVARHASGPLPSTSISLGEAERRLPAPFTRRQLRLLFTDHWYDSSRLWRTIDPPGPGGGTGCGRSCPACRPRVADG
ncbi:NAD-dependent epimerase/dehydratase family protein [Plantactinospora veratri]|uniref:NAD-dependent epimerase/dehydratase family protein n=1 Tax=Plantactinospora veratri TaxID=1436122 RepID=A0ABU7SGQ5_9ACTN